MIDEVVYATQGINTIALLFQEAHADEGGGRLDRCFPRGQGTKEKSGLVETLFLERQNTRPPLSLFPPRSIPIS